MRVTLSVEALDDRDLAQLLRVVQALEATGEHVHVAPDTHVLVPAPRLEEGRDALRQLVTGWRVGGDDLGPTVSQTLSRSGTAISSYVAACGGLVDAVHAVWRDRGEAITPAEDAEERRHAEQCAGHLLAIAGALGFEVSSLVGG